MRKFYFIFALLLVSQMVYSQCESIAIPRTGWTIHSFDTEETEGEGANNGHAIHAIDGNINTFWHSRWKNYNSSFPHFIAVDMGQAYPIDGLSVTSRNDSPNNKPKAYEIYLSNDGENWDPLQAAGQFNYPNVNASGQTAAVSFGAVNARYFKILSTSSWDNSVHTVISEINATQISGPGCGASGQNNQILSFQAIPKKYTTDEPFALLASSSSGLPLEFTIVEGSATINGNILTLNGTGGMVTVKASQAGNAEFYPAEVSQTFEVVDLSAIQPQVISRLTEDYPVQMPELMPYYLYARAEIDESDVLSIQNIEFFADGQPVTADAAGSIYRALWTPSSFGNHLIEIKATGSNGVSSTKSYNINVSNTISTQDVITLNGAVIDMGTIGSQWYYGTYTLPQSVGSYDKIMAEFNVSCPNVAGGCDDWDRLAWIQVKDVHGKWIELFRYITPYGVACNHSIDVTDYESVLQGEIEFRVFIDTWGTGGWKMDLNFNYQQGTPGFAYTSVDEIWHGYFNFGDLANLQPVPVREINAPENTEQAAFRLVTTGHGWGSNNTSNAAEFYFATHNLKVNGQNTFTQFLKTICNPNPDNCTGQMGTWQYNRAGWCPGTIPQPFFYDMTPYIGSSFNFTYEFQPTYTDNCHPNNPNCVSGQTCPDCNDGYNPHYRVGAYMIYKSNSPLGLMKTDDVVEIKSNRLIAYPNANNGFFRLALENEMLNPVVEIVDFSGQALKTYFFKNQSELNNFTFNIQYIPSGVYFVKVYNVKEIYSTRIIKK